MKRFATLSNIFLFQSKQSSEQEDHLFLGELNSSASPSINLIEPNRPYQMSQKQRAFEYHKRTWNRNTLEEFYGRASSTQNIQFNGTLQKKSIKRN